VLEITVQGLLIALSCLVAFALFGVDAVAAWKWFMPGELWEFVEEDDISQHFNLLRRDYWLPLWRRVSPKQAGLPLELSDCRTSMHTIDEKARTDDHRLMSCTEKYRALLARIEALDRMLRHT